MAGRVVRVLIVSMVPIPVLSLDERDAVADDGARFSEGKVTDDGVSCRRSDFFLRFFPGW